MKKILSFITVLVVIPLMVSACSEPSVGTPSEYTISPHLQSLYDKLGGREVLGPAVSDVGTDEHGIVFQYFRAALLQYDPRTGFASVAPVGGLLDVEEPPESGSHSPQDRYVNLYWIPEEIWKVYNQLGPENVGRPLSNFRFVKDGRRYEMFFENLGFYILENDEAKDVKLLSYGSWSLAAHPQPKDVNIPVSPPTGTAGTLFDQVAARMGEDFMGQELVAMTLDDNNNPMRIFENVVIWASTENPNRVNWLPLCGYLGIGTNPPVPAKNDPRYYFQAVDGDLGHNVPLEFWDFIMSHGGLEVSGNPITETYYPANNRDIVEQCFENLCLNYIIATGEIRLARLGLEFSRRYHEPQPESESLMVISMKVWEASPSLPPNQSQEFNIYTSQNNKPLANINPVLEISQPDGQHYIYNMPTTGEDGQSYLRVPSIDAPNGSVIPYQVCIPNVNATRFCVKDSFLIWGGN